MYTTGRLSCLLGWCHRCIVKSVLVMEKPKAATAFLLPQSTDTPHMHAVIISHHGMHRVTSSTANCEVPSLMQLPGCESEGLRCAAHTGHSCRASCVRVLGSLSCNSGGPVCHYIHPWITCMLCFLACECNVCLPYQPVADTQ